MEANQKRDKPETGSYFQFYDLFTYFFRKKDPNRKTNFSIKVMHGINKISILIFLLAVIVLLVRHVF